MYYIQISSTGDWGEGTDGPEKHSVQRKKPLIQLKH